MTTHVGPPLFPPDITPDDDYILELIVNEPRRGKRLLEKRRDISQWTITSSLRTNTSKTGPTAADFTVTKTDPTNGVFRIALSRTLTAALTRDSDLFWDIQVVDGDGTRFTLFAGYVIHVGWDVTS